MGITTSVGLGGVTKGPDVGLIQKKLNQHFRVVPGYRTALSKAIKIYDAPTKALKVDNDCGPATIKAIKLFQKVVLKWANPDGRVDPGGRTWKALNGNVSTAMHVVKKSGKYVKLSQWDYPKTKIGYSSSQSIQQIGCTLTTLTMAATAIGSSNEYWPEKLLPKDLTPVEANEVLKKAGAFTGGDMIVKDGAAALGMTYEEYGKKTNLTSQDLTRLTAHLAKGYPVAAHVDYKNSDKAKDDSGDHWILLVRSNCDGSFTAIDPMFGGEISLQKSANKNERYKGERANQKTGVLFGSTGGQDPRAGPKTRAGQQKYIVVRFGLLSPIKNQSISQCKNPMMPQTSNKGFGDWSLESSYLIWHGLK